MPLGARRLFVTSVAVSAALTLLALASAGVFASKVISPPVVGAAVALLGAVQLVATRLSVSAAVTPPQHDDVVAQVRRRIESTRRHAMYDETTDLYQRWYFELRLQEEANRCLRYDLSMAVLVVSAGEMSVSDFTESDWLVVASAAAYRTARSVRNVDLVAALAPLEFALCLVHCDRQGADTAAGRVAEQLEGGCRIGIAVYPADGCEPKELLPLARSRLAPAPAAHAA
jgi:GGDEF domain-containing protein